MHALARALTLIAVTIGVAVCAPSQTTATQSKEVNATGSIAGHVTVAGKPAAGIPVSLTADPQTGRREHLAISSTTDGDGHFQLSRVPAGRFYVMAFAPAFYSEGYYRVYGLPPGRYAVSAGTPLRQGDARMGEGNSYYTQTFYPGTTDETRASEVEVTEGGEGEPDLTVNFFERSAPSDKGEFVIACLEAGQYHLELSMPGEDYFVRAITFPAPAKKKAAGGA
jgi:5-hydroxyisourate hydrolase-like protein (transthyretin family)